MKTVDNNSVEIIPFSSIYQKDFYRINFAWIDKYFEFIELDERVYSDPQTEIIEKGGFIFLAKINNKVVGSASLEKLNNTEYVLARMGVDEAYQGLKIGQALLTASLQKAKILRIKKVVLYTNQFLIKALNLYVKNGFKFVNLDKIGYDRATIKMERYIY